MKKESERLKLFDYEESSASGITLIALVITIIVLLILAGVSISAAIGENGILTRAENAVEEDAIGKEKEIVQLSVTEAAMNEEMTYTFEEFQTILHRNSNNSATAEMDDDGEKILVTFTESNRTYTVDYNNNIEIFDDYVARINEKKYKTLQDAFNEVPETNTETTVYLLKDTEESTDIKETQNIKLEMQNNTVQGYFENNGNLKINTGKINAWAESTCISNNGTLEINNIEFSNAIIENNNSMTIKDSIINGRYDYTTLRNSENATMIIESSSSEKISMNNRGTMTIKKSELATNSVTNQMIANYGILNITENSEIYYTASRSIIQNYEGGEINLSDSAVISESGYDTIENKANATLNVTGDSAVMRSGGSSNYSAINNSGNVYIRDNAYIYSAALRTISNSGILEVTGGEIRTTYSSENALAISNYGTATITSNVICYPKNSDSVEVI